MEGNYASKKGNPVKRPHISDSRTGISRLDARHRYRRTTTDEVEDTNRDIIESLGN